MKMKIYYNVFYVEGKWKRKFEHQTQTATKKNCFASWEVIIEKNEMNGNIDRTVRQFQHIKKVFVFYLEPQQKQKMKTSKMY